MSETPANGGTQFRLAALERALERLQDRVERNMEIQQALAVLATEFKLYVRDTEERLEDLENSFEKDVKGLRRLLITFSLTVAGSAVAFAITTLVVFGGPTP